MSSRFQPFPKQTLTDRTQNDDSENEMEIFEASQKSKKKTPASLRKLRKNKLLSRMIQPKPPIMILHEMKPGTIFKLEESSLPANCGEKFTATCVFKDKTIGQGEGKSKMEAKNAAAEAALQKIFVENFKSEPVAAEENQTKIHEGNVELKEDELLSKLSTYEKIPWSNLASYAIQQLFNKWKEEGIDIPVQQSRNDEKMCSEYADMDPVHFSPLPLNAKEIHPVSLLNQMFPGIKAEELQRTSASNSSVTVGYKIAGQYYVGSATNSKYARKIAATHACKTLFGLKFED